MKKLEDSVTLNRALREISKNCATIQELIGGRSRIAFISDGMAIARIRQPLRAIREATRAITYEFKVAHPEIDWSNLTAVQIVFFHEYFGIDVDAVWKIFNDAIASLIRDFSNLSLIPKSKI